MLKSKGKTRSRDKKGGGGFFRWIFLIVILGIAIAGGLTQLPKLGINQISDLFPVSGQAEEAAEAEASNPVQTLLQAEPQESSNTTTEQPQGALIRIE